MVRFFLFVCFFSIWIFFHDHSQITGLQGKGEGLSLTPYYHFTRFTDTLVSERKPLTTKPRSLLRMLNYANSTSGYENWCFFILSSLMLKQVDNFRKFGTRCTKVFVDRLMFLDFSKSGMQYLWQGEISVCKVLMLIKVVLVKNNYFLYQKFELHRYQQTNRFLYLNSFYWKKIVAYFSHKLIVRLIPTWIWYDILTVSHFWTSNHQLCYLF